MTDEEAGDDAWVAWSEATYERRLQLSDNREYIPMNDAFDAGFRAGLVHARQWRKLSADPATWPEEGPCLFVRVSRAGNVTLPTVAEGDVHGLAPHVMLEGMTHWLPLPPAPPDEAKETP